MKNIKVNSFTWSFLLLAFLCGYIKVAIIIIFIVFIHELGHIFFIHLFSYKVIDVTLYPFGGITRIEKDLNIPLKHEFLIACGGIFFQVLLYVILLLPMQDITHALFFKYNTSILFFNLLPIIPLDGSIIINTFLNRFFSYKSSYIIYCIISILFIGLYLFFNYWISLNNYFIIVLFCYKTYEAIKNFKYLYNRFLLERYLKEWKFKRIETKEGDLSLLKRETYQYFIEENHIVSEKKKLANRFDKERIF